jgi:trigger factor
MRANLESVDALKRRLEVSMPSDAVAAAVQKHTKSFSKNVRLKGFRPGKAPLPMVQQMYGPQIQQEALSQLMRQSLGQALLEHGLAPVAPPEVEPLPPLAPNELRYAARFEVFPHVELTNLAAITVERPQADVTDADIDAMIETLRKQRPNYVPASAPGVAGDRVLIDFEGRLDGVAFAGGTGKDVPVIIGSGRMIKDFDAALVGMSQGETKVVPVQFPEDYQNAELKGKLTEFTITVTKLEQAVLPALDEAFCELFGVTAGGLATLREEVADNMRRELGEVIKNRVKTQLLDKVLETHPLELPQTAVEQEIRAMQADWLRRNGTDPAKLKQALPREPFEAAAKRRVAVGLIIGEVIRSEKIQVPMAALEERMEVAALSFADPDAAYKQIKNNERARNQLAAAILEDEAVEKLVTRVTVNTVPSTFKEIMNFGAE